MASDVGRAGIDTYTLYGTETTYGTKASTIASHFGIVQSVTPSNRNNLLQQRGFRGTTTGGRELIKSLGGKYETTVSIEFQPQHCDWLKHVMGTRTGAGTSTSKYVYTTKITSITTSRTENKLVDTGTTFDTGPSLINAKVYNTTDSTYARVTAVDDANTLSISADIMASEESYTLIIDNLTPLTITTNKELGSNTRHLVYLGGKINSCTIRSSFGEVVTISIEVFSSNTAQDTILETPIALDAADVYTFEGSAVEWPNATPITNVIDSFELTITNNIEVLYGLGSRTGQKSKEKAREYGLRLTMKTEDNTYSTAFLGSATAVTTPTEVATVEFNFSGGTNHTANFLFSSVTLDEWSDPETLAEVVPEELSGIAESLVVTEQQTT